MDYVSHLRSIRRQQQLQQQQAGYGVGSLCTEVNYGSSSVGSMMALMTDHEQAESEQQHNHHQQQHHNHHHQHLQHQPQQQQFMSAGATHGALSSSYYINHMTSVPHPTAEQPYSQHLQAVLYQAYNQLQQPAEPFSVMDPVGSQQQLVGMADHNQRQDMDEHKPEHLKMGSHFSRSNSTTTRSAASHSTAQLVSPGGSSTQHEPGSIASTTVDFDNAHKIYENDPDKAKIIAHPSYPRLVLAYTNCQKIGAPPEVVTRMDEIGRKFQTSQIPSTSAIGGDPELDQFMDAYCDMLQKYHDELTRPYKEAISFFRKIELRLNALSKGTVRLSNQSVDDKVAGEVGPLDGGGSGGGGSGGGGGSTDDEDGEVDFHVDDGDDPQQVQSMMIDPLAEEQKIKEQLMRRYSSYIPSLKQEFLKKKKKGKLPKEARQKLLDWWTQHYKWPYPSETEKAALAETTGLDQKQINNWFINQRKRHWKPSEDMQFVMVDTDPAAALQAAAMNHATNISMHHPHPHPHQHEDLHHHSVAASTAHHHPHHHHHHQHYSHSSHHPAATVSFNAHEHSSNSSAKPDVSGPLGPMDHHG